jgi:hypothetical protein
MAPRGWVEPHEGKLFLYDCVDMGIYFKNILMKNHWTRKSEIYKKAL